MLQISGQSNKARVSYSDFKKCCEKKEKKNTKKIRRTMKVHISGTAWRIQLKFGVGGAPPRGNSRRNFVCFCSGNVELVMRENGVFFTPVKYILVCCAPWVSWAARHTTVCLDCMLKSKSNFYHVYWVNCFEKQTENHYVTGLNIGGVLFGG